MIFQIFIGAIIAFIGYICITHILLPYLRYRFYRKYGEGEFHPFLGELVQFMNGLNKHDNMDYYFHHQLDSNPDQKIYVVNNGTSVKLRLIEPEIVKEFYLKQNLYVKASTRIDNMQRFIHEGIVFAEGDKWKISRRLFSKAFNFEYLKTFSDKIEAASNRVFQKLIESNETHAVDVMDVFQLIAGQVIMLSFFGETLEDTTFQGMKLANALAYTLGKLGDQAMSMKYFLFGKRFFELGLTADDRKYNKYLIDIQEFIQNKLNTKIEEIQAEIAQTGKTTNQSILAQLVLDKQIDTITREQLYLDFTTFYLAGIDSIGHLLGMLVYYLTQHPHIYKKLQEEIDGNTNQTAAALTKLPYLNATINETLRYYGPANFIFDRVAQADHYLGEIPIKKGTLVTVHSMTYHRSEKLYKDPHTFDPSRWLGNLQKELPSHGFVSFSAGARNCIGQHLALLESAIILNNFVKTFEFECPADYRPRMTMKFLLEPIDPLPIKLTQRKKNIS